jgi:hypothetical protein
MTENQIKYLKLLGYEGTQEDGAILQHRRFHDMGRFIWKDETFQEVLSMYPARLEYAVKRDSANKIMAA